MSLEIKNISKKYKTQIALSNICFSLKKGDIVGFLGPNGAGKTTLMKIITSTLQQDMGSVSINGFDTIENKLDTKAQVGYLAEKRPLYNEMYVTEYLDFIASIYNLSDKKKKIQSIIHKTGLDLEKSKKIEQLSKGYKQRVGLAAALVHNPNILILDEPTTGLDPNQLVEIRNLIKETGKDKIVLLSTHIMQEIPKICNKIIIINKGKIVDNRDINEFNTLKLNLEEHFQKLTS